MNALAKFQASNAWDSRFNLPLVPIHNNPWIYLAYAVKMMLANGMTVEELKPLGNLIEEHLWNCAGTYPGEFYRWPDRSGGNTSHDELMGIAYLDFVFNFNTKPTQLILKRLLETDGEYNVHNEPSDIPERWNVKRFIWLEPFLRACTKGGFRTSLFNQFWFCWHVVKDLWDYRKDDAHVDEGAANRMWLMLEPMEQYMLPWLVLKFWKKRMGTIGVSPKTNYSVYLKECPIYYELAPSNFEMPKPA